jgi:EmrB/QacA subfamily drug resistance transporter
MSSAVARMKSSGSKFSRRPGEHSSKPPHTKTDRSNTNRWLVLIIVAAAQLMVVLDATIVNVALPHAQAALHISDSNRQWVVTAYSLAFGGLLLLGGRIADYTGRRRTFLVGLIGFAGASAIGGVSQSGDMLFAARACQGAFAALLAPSALSILSTTFKSGPDRVKAFAVYGGVSASGAAIGLLIGGILTQYLSWRWTLLVNTPIAVIAVLAGLRYVPDSRAEGKTRYDIPGAATVTLGLVSLVYGCSKASTDGWGSDAVLSFLAAGVVLLVTFVIIELRSSHPLLPMRVVLDRNRGGANLVAAAIGAAIVGAFVFLIYYMQEILGYSPVKTGLASVPISLAIAPAVVIAARLVPKVGPRVLMTAGGLLAAAGMFLLSQSTITSSYVDHILPAELILGFGMGLAFTPLQNLATLGVSGNDAGAASALISASQQIGGAIGAAVFNTFFVTVMNNYIGSHAHTQAAHTQALMHGYNRAFLLGAVASLLAAASAAIVIRARAKELPASESMAIPA